MRSAEIAKNDFPGADIRIIDTRTVAGPLGALVLEADRLAKQGASADEVEARVREMMARARIYFIVDTLEFLRRGGRIGGAQALMGTVLQIKPILTLVDGRIDQFERERTKKKALARMQGAGPGRIGARPGRACERQPRGRARRRPRNSRRTSSGRWAPTTCMILDMPPAIVTHAGPGTAGRRLLHPGLSAAP